jgi:hypothetical protein
MKFRVKLRRKSWLWLGVSVFVSLYFGIISLGYALSQDYLIQDDARLHIVWLQKFINPQLFNHDLIADYYQAIASGIVLTILLTGLLGAIN